MRSTPTCGPSTGRRLTPTRSSTSGRTKSSAGADRGLRALLRSWGPALPLLAVLFVCLVVPLAALLARSFVTTEGIGLSVWSRVLGQPINQRAIVTSLELGLTCAAISTLVG